MYILSTYGVRTGRFAQPPGSRYSGPMIGNDYWSALRAAVQQAVDDGRIGRPAALRLTVHVAGDAAEAERCSTALRHMAAGWFGGAAGSSNRIGGGGALLEALRWPGGESALVAVSAGAGPAGGNLMLMGSNGTVYHEFGGSEAGRLRGPDGIGGEPSRDRRLASETARYGVVAVGGNRTHLEDYARKFAADPRCELRAVADQPGLPEYREGLNRLLAAELELPYLPLEQALALAGVDIVINCADVERRAPVAVAILRAGKHLYADKPLAGTREAAREIAAAAAAAGVTTQLFTQVWSAWAQQARAAIDGGVTGRVHAVHCDMLMAKGKPGTVAPGTVRRERPGDGRFTFVGGKRELFDMGVYPIALVQWLTGRRIAEVHAMTGNYFFAEHAALDIEDYGALALTLDDGRVASICCGRIGATSHPRMGEQRITLIAERGIFTFSDASPRLEVYHDQPPFTTPTVHPFDPMQMWSSSQRDIQPRAKDRWLPLASGRADADVRAFLDCIDSGRRPQVTVGDAVHHVDVILAGYESAVSGQPVRLPG